MFHRRLHPDRNRNFKGSPLRYASKTKIQYLTTVKLPGSFRLAAGNRHLHRYCIFTGRLVETVFKSLSHSCGPELTRQGITLPLDDYSYRRRSLVLHSVSHTHHATCDAQFEIYNLQFEINLKWLNFKLLKLIKFKFQISNFKFKPHMQCDAHDPQT